MVAKKNESTETLGIALARVEERLTALSDKFVGFELWFKRDYLHHFEERIEKIETHNKVQDKKIESANKKLWITHGAVAALLFVLNIAFMLWRIIHA